MIYNYEWEERNDENTLCNSRQRTGQNKVDGQSRTLEIVIRL